jgi:hypothetical protein
MGLNFNDIILEQTNPKSSKFVDMILPKMKEYFEGKYHDSHWTDAASFMDSQTVGEFRESMKIAKEKGEEIAVIIEKLNNFEKYTPKGLDILHSKYFKVNKEFNSAISKVTHIKNLFHDMMGSDDHFIDRYAVPVGVLVDVWEKFYEEVYKPGKIEHRKNIGGVTFMYGLPEGDYGEKTFYNSMYGAKRYFVMKDNALNDNIVGVDVRWDWKALGVVHENLYYKPFKSNDEIISFIKDMEFDYLMNELKGAEVDYSPAEVKTSYSALENNIDTITREGADDYDGNIEQALSQYLDYEGIVEPNHDMYGSGVATLSKYLLVYYKIINQF